MKMKDFIVLFIFPIIFIPNFSYSKIMCKNEQNKDIDWFIVIKYPKTFDFVFISSNSKDMGWKESRYSLESDRNIVAVTLRQVYDNKKDSFYAFYNDAKPNSNSSSSGGHLKGVINMDKSSGFWLIHSVPQFPTEKIYAFNRSQSIYGQSLMCVSLEVKLFKTIIQQLLIMYSTVYSYKMPDYYNQDSEMKDLLNNFVKNSRKNKTVVNVFNFKTFSMEMIHFAKSENFNKDLYAELIASTLKDSLYVESWTNGQGGKLDSECKLKFQVYNINQVNLSRRTFNSTQDHSKWAVSKSITTPFVCMGDINRMKSQFKRGGGSLCLLNEKIWKMFKDSIIKFENCV